MEKEENKKHVDFLTIILVAILLILLFFYGQLRILGKEYVNVCGYTFFQVITGSMSGTIEINDIVIVRITDKFKVNDIITYKSGNDYVTHRVIRIQGDTIITKGDANNTEDEPITKDLVLGRVVHIFNNVNTWIKVIKTPQVIIALIVGFIAINLLLQKKK